MADDELEEIRKKRMAEMQQQYGGGGGGGGKAAAEQEERKNQMEDMKNSILSQALDQQARARLNTLMLAKPEKGRMIENYILQMAQRGGLPGKIGEDELKGLLSKISDQTQNTTKVKFDRRRAAFDSDDDDY